MTVSKGPINLGKRLRMGLRPSVGAGMSGPPPVAAPGAMPMMKKGGRAGKKHPVASMDHDFMGDGVHTTPSASNRDPDDHICMNKGGRARRKK